MKVVMVIQNFYPSIGGAERQALTLARELVKKHVSVTVLTRRVRGSRAREFMDGVEVRRLGTDAFSFMVCSFAWLIFSRRRYDIIHAHIGSSHAVSAAFAGRLLNKKTIVKLSGSKLVGEIPVSRRSFVGRLKLRAFGFLRPTLVVVSEGQKEDLRGFGLESLETQLIPNGVDTSKFRPATSDEKASLRKNLKWDGVVFLFVGRFSSDKLRIDIFRNVLSAWSRLAGGSSQSGLYFVGEGELEKNYRDEIDQLHLEGSVHLCPSTENVRALYQAADVFVLPSITEGLSNALLEAMACGLPVAGSRVPGIQDFLSENVEGRLFNPLVPEEIYQSFRELFQNSVARRRMGQAAMELAHRFSIENSVTRHMALYQVA